MEKKFSKILTQFGIELKAFDKKISEKYSTVYGTYGEVIKNDYNLSKPSETVNVLATSFYNKNGRIVATEIVPDTLIQAHNALITSRLCCQTI
jgi:hypothetical protein